MLYYDWNFGEDVPLQKISGEADCWRLSFRLLLRRIYARDLSSFSRPMIVQWRSTHWCWIQETRSTYQDSVDECQPHLKNLMWNLDHWKWVSIISYLCQNIFRKKHFERRTIKVTTDDKVDYITKEIPVLETYVDKEIEEAEVFWSEETFKWYAFWN